MNTITVELNGYEIFITQEIDKMIILYYKEGICVFVETINEFFDKRKEYSTD